MTRDGAKNAIINGAADWVYEEEFSFHKGFEWSPDGTKIAYYSFFEGDVTASAGSSITSTSIKLSELLFPRLSSQ